MNIAVVDVAAESGGALSVLNDFLDYIQSDEVSSNHMWYIFTSIPLDIKVKYVKNIVCSDIKKSWFQRLFWEKCSALKQFNNYKIDIILSLQNTAFTGSKIPQYVYFHNVLLLEKSTKYSLLNKSERKYALYTKLIAPYTISSLKRAKHIIVQTEVAKEELIKKVSNSNYHVIRPNVVIPNEIIPEESYDNKILGVIYPTSCVPFKKIEDIVLCVKNNIEWFKNNNFSLLLTIKGDENEYAKKIYNLADGLPIIKFIGYQKREDMLRYYMNYAIIINSELESYPLPFLEGAYIGTPIISANYGYSKAILQNNNNSVLYTANDISSMFEAIKTVSSYRIKGPISSVISYNTWKDVVGLLQNN